MVSRRKSIEERTQYRVDGSRLGPEDKMPQQDCEVVVSSGRGQRYRYRYEKLGGDANFVPDNRRARLTAQEGTVPKKHLTLPHHHLTAPRLLASHNHLTGQPQAAPT